MQIEEEKWKTCISFYLDVRSIEERRERERENQRERDGWSKIGREQ